MNQTISRLKQLATLCPSDPDVRLDLARELIAAAQVDEAVREIRAVINIAPNHLEARKLLRTALDTR